MLRKTGLSEYLINIIPQKNHPYITQSNEYIATFYCITDFKHPYFPLTIMEWDKRDIQIRRSTTLLS